MGKRTGNNSTLGYYTMGIVALFLVGFFLLVMFGARSYRDTVAGQYANMDERAQLSYLATTVRANDTEDSVSVEGSADAPILIVRDGASGYAFRIYTDHGQLLEDYDEADEPLHPEDAQVIGKTDRFAVEITGRVLRIHTDAGSVTVTLRSGEGSV